MLMRPVRQFLADRCGQCTQVQAHAEFDNSSILYLSLFSIETRSVDIDTCSSGKQFADTTKRAGD